MSIFPGKYGQSSTRLRRLFIESKGLQKVNVAPIVKNLRLEIVANDLYVRWDSEAAITKLIFIQGTLRVQYVLSNYHSKFSIPFKDFKNFTTNITNIYAYHATSEGESLYLINSNYGTVTNMRFKAI